MLRGKLQIIITGATGFVGAHLVRHYSRLGHSVIATGRQKSPPKALFKYAQWYQLDLMSNNYPDIYGDVLIHAGGMASDEGEYEAFHELNVDASVRLYKWFEGNHFIYISSGSVYKYKNEPLEESITTRNTGLSAYGKSKLEAEATLAQLVKGRNQMTLLRPRAIYGTNDRVLLPKILKLYKEKIQLVGSMDIEVSMTHISNLIEAVDAAIKLQTKSFQLLNVADNQVYNLREVVVSLINKIAKQELKTRRLPLGIIRPLTYLADTFNLKFPLSPQSLNYLTKSCVLDTSRIKKNLKVKLNRNFYDELDSIAEWVEKVGIDRVRSADPLLPWIE